MEILNQFATGLSQNLTNDFLKLLLLLPIGIVIDLIIKAIKKRSVDNGKERKIQKNLNKQEQKELEKALEKNRVLTETFFYILLIPVALVIVAGLATAIFQSGIAGAIAGGIFLISVIILIVRYKKQR